MLFDDLAADTAQQYERLMDFIDVEAMPRADYSARRGSKSVRSRWLQRLLKRPPKAMQGYFAGEQFRQRIRNLDDPDSQVPNAVLSLRKRLLAWNRVPRTPEPLPMDLHTQLCREFGGEVERLGVGAHVG